MGSFTQSITLLNKITKMKFLTKKGYGFFEAISDTDNINISVMYFSEMTKTYPVLYSYYGKEKRFITH